MLLHTEVSIVIDTYIPFGISFQTLFEDVIPTPVKAQTEENYVTFWDLGGLVDHNLPIRVDILRNNSRNDCIIVYTAPLAQALTEAVTLDITRMLVRLTWTGQPSPTTHRVSLNLRMDVDVRRRSSSFRHIVRKSSAERHDSTTLPQGETRILRM